MEVGFISSITQPFCGDCIRLRLTADGKVLTCLFAQDGYDVKSIIRSGADEEEIKKPWLYPLSPHGLSPLPRQAYDV